MQAITQTGPESYVKLYTLEDMTRTAPPHVNSWNCTLYDGREIVVALQGTFDEQRRRAKGSSPIHSHDRPTERFDELVCILNEEYGTHNRAEVIQTGSYLRIPAGVFHGGDANGVWVSAKTKGFEHKESSTDGLTIEYSGKQPGGLIVNFGESFDRIPDEKVYGLSIMVEATPESLRVFKLNELVKTELIGFGFLR